MAQARANISWQRVGRFDRDRAATIIITNDTGANLYISFGDLPPSDRNDAHPIISGGPTFIVNFVTQDVWIASDIQNALYQQTVMRSPALGVFPHELPNQGQ